MFFSESSQWSNHVESCVLAVYKASGNCTKCHSVFLSTPTRYLSYSQNVKQELKSLVPLDMRTVFLFSKISICPLSAPPKPPHHPELPLENSEIGPCNVWEKRICFLKPLVQQIMLPTKLKRLNYYQNEQCVRLLRSSKSQPYHQCPLPKSAAYKNTIPSP